MPYYLSNSFKLFLYKNIMKKISLFLLLGLFAFTTKAQWTRTHISTTNNVNISDICEHNGSLYGVVFDNGLMKYNESNSTWEKINVTFNPSDNPSFIQRLLSSGNYLYAYVNYQGCASTMIFRSTDGGSTFNADTAGHPVYVNHPYKQCKGAPFNVANAFELNGKLINVINGGFYSKYPEDQAWVKTTDPKVTFGEQFAEHNNTWYCWSDNYQLHSSKDSGNSWNTPTNTGLPSMFYAKVLQVNPSSGRIYIAGNSLSSGTYKLLYSDDEGGKWDSLPINQYLGKDWLGQGQVIFGLISKGDNITAMLENDASNSRIDVIKSTDGGQTFSIDTVGLTIDPFGTVSLRKFLYFKGQLWMAPNLTDVFTQGDKSTHVKSVHAINLNVYPNPFRNTLKIQCDSRMESIEIHDVLGNMVLSIQPMYSTYTFSFSHLPSGIYFVTVTSNQQKKTIKVLKQE